MENYPPNYPQEENFSFKKLLIERKSEIVYLWKHKWMIIGIGLIGGVLGLILSFFWPITYTARLTFVVEDAKPSGGSLVSALAGQFGFDLSSLGGASGVLAGDNVEQLLRSNTILKSTLLTSYGDAQHHTLADIYATKNKLKEAWEKKYLKDGSTLSFPSNTLNYTRLQDSLLQDIEKRIQKDGLSIAKPDKKLSFFELTTTMKDERLAQLLCIRVLNQGADFYIRTKTKRLKTNVDRLQTRADSLTDLLNLKTYQASSSNKNLLDVNPAYPTAKVGTEVKERDKLVLSTIYSEVVKNLEISKTMLMQETPTVQIVDQPELPLQKNRLKWWKGIIYGVFFGALITSIYLLFGFKKIEKN
ncbi:MAG: hypothetical protein IE931_00090 [Sphingobacteriales bacterium]|nr:hypothetical protein [Sphingobacteriales bacterium]